MDKGEIIEAEVMPVNKNDRNGLTTFNPTNQRDYFNMFVAFIDATPNTLRTYKTSLKQWFKFTQEHNIQQPKPEDVKLYRKELQDAGKRATTVQNYIMAVKQFFKWTEEAGIYRDIAKHVKGVRISTEHKKDYLTSKQARKILLAIDRTSVKGKRDYAMLVLMLTMGLRTVEVSRSNIEDMRASGDTTVLYVQGKGHDEKDAPVRMPEHVENAIREYLKARGNISPKEPLFTSTSHNNAGQRLTTRSISGTVKSCFKQAGFNSDRLTAHSTRHTAATLNLLNGGTLEETQQLLRHANLQTTEIYAHHLTAIKNKSSNRVDNAIFGKDMQTY